MSEVLRRRPHFLLLGALAALVAAGCGGRDPAALVEQARQATEKGELKEAEIWLRMALDRDPNLAAAHYALAGVHEKTGRLGYAYWELQETVRLDPAHDDARLRLARYLILDRRYDDALVHGAKLVESRPKAVDGRLVRATAFEKLERFDEAEAAYQEAVRASGEDREALSALASFYVRRARPDDAEKAWLRRVELQPDVASYTELGRFYAGQRGRDEDAKRAFDQVLELAGPEEMPLAYTNLFYFHFLRRQLDEARDVLTRGLARIDDPARELSLVYLLARFEHAVGNAARAAEVLEEAIRANPSDPRPHLVKSSYLELTGDVQKALAAAVSAGEADPESSLPKLRAAELMLELDAGGEETTLVEPARKMVEEVLVREPSNALAFLVRAKLELQTGDSQASERSARLALEAQPDSARARHLLGASLVAQGKPQSARAELVHALSLDPDQLAARELLTNVLFDLGDHAAAAEQGLLYLGDRPADARMRAVVAESLARSGRLDEAQQLLDAFRPATPDVHLLYARARLHMDRGEFDAARPLLLQAAEAAPFHDQILMALQEVESKLGLGEASKQRLEQAIAAQGSNARLRLLRGITRAFEGDLADAEEDLVAAQDLDPSDVGIAHQLAQLQLRTGRTADAITAYTVALDVRPDDARLHFWLATILLRDSKARAIEHLERAVALDPAQPAALNNLAYLLVGEAAGPSDPVLVRAVELADRARALQPDDANVADTLGWVKLKRGEPAAAKLLFEQAISKANPGDPNLGLYRYHLAQAYEASGELDQSVESLKEAVSDAQRQKATGAAQAAGAAGDAAWLADARADLRRLMREQIR